MAICWAGRVQFMAKPPQGVCKEPTVDNSIYCARHLAEAIARVEMVRDDDRPTRWSGGWDSSRKVWT